MSKSTRVKLPLRFSPEDLGVRRVVHRLLRDGWRVYNAGYPKDELQFEVRPNRLWLHKSLQSHHGGLGNPGSYVILRVHHESVIPSEAPSWPYTMRLEYQTSNTHIHRYVTLRVSSGHPGPGWADTDDFIRLCKAIYDIPYYFGSDGGLGKVVELGQQRVLVQRQNHEVRRHAERAQVVELLDRRR